MLVIPVIPECIVCPLECLTQECPAVEPEPASQVSRAPVGIQLVLDGIRTIVPDVLDGIGLELETVPDLMEENDEPGVVGDVRVLLRTDV
jgi:hypothetical protein